MELKLQQVDANQTFTPLATRTRTNVYRKIAEQVKAVPAGKALVVETPPGELPKYFRYYLRKACQKAGVAVSFALTKEGKLVIVKSPAATAVPPEAKPKKK
jgi:hypothetical protein